MVSREDSEAEQEDGDGEDEGSGAFTPKIDELENLLEAYFVQIDGTLNKLSAVQTPISIASFLTDERNC